MVSIFRTACATLAGPPSNANGHRRTEPREKPTVCEWGDSGPPVQHSNEIRRHYYSSCGAVMKVKIKKRGERRFTQWYRVFNDSVPVGWQDQKPRDYVAIPYVTAALDPFDPEPLRDEILWPEGEKDVETLSKLNLPAFTFGGVGDGLPDGIAHYLKDRHIVILADNDQQGRDHAEKKAAVAQTATAASIKIVHFPELPEKGDVSDFFDRGGTIEQLNERVDSTAPWSSLSATSAETAPKSNGGPAALVSRCAADIVPEKIEWLWPGRLARGKHTWIAGEPGTGKSQLTIAIIAAVTTGGGWPCGEGRAPIGNVIILSAEDGAADTIVPRLLAAGANLDRVHVVSAVQEVAGNRRALNLQNDLALLEKKIAEVGEVALVVIDPISSYLGRTDSHKNAEVRGVLEPLSEMAERMRVAVLSVTHFSKTGANSTTKALHRFIGSIAFTGAPRAAFAVIEDAEHEGRRLFLLAKTNLSGRPQGLAFRLEQCDVRDGIIASRVVWDGEPVAITANEALAADAGSTDNMGAKVEAIDFLRWLMIRCRSR
jgi:AAA domain